MARGSRFLDGANPPILHPPPSPLPPPPLQVGIQLCIVFTVLVFKFLCMYFYLKLLDNTAAIGRCCDGQQWHVEEGPEVPSEADLRRQQRQPLRLRNLPGGVRRRR
ncbi:unnamed protein product [Fraxinus pennsylvanica]|uniref:Uncharacterized protein n=1 Tax=Fraxinus pennsylvanica TaxID=56036 RepID=A0AAD2E9K3_9LAMI|nr:unnamed protein product [Fraxinus pennsylvanica]